MNDSNLSTHSSNSVYQMMDDSETGDTSETYNDPGKRNSENDHTFVLGDGASPAAGDTPSAGAIYSDLDSYDTRAMSAGRSSRGASASKSQAVFVNKLYSMLEDSEIQHLISWSPNGEQFGVPNPTLFSREVLPQYFKHNNWQSFVRQLNMYGFNKVNDMIHSNLTNENQNWEFRHPNFRRGAVDDLKNIKRKSAKSRHHYQAQPSSSAVSVIEGDEPFLEPINTYLQDMEERLFRVSNSYEILWREAASLKSELSKQQEIIDNLIGVLQILMQERIRSANPVNGEALKTGLERLSTALQRPAFQVAAPPMSSTASEALHYPLPDADRSLPSFADIRTTPQGDNKEVHLLKPPSGYGSSEHRMHYPYPGPVADILNRRSQSPTPGQKPYAHYESQISPRTNTYSDTFDMNHRSPSAYLRLGSDSRLLNPAPASETISDRKQKKAKHPRIAP